MPQCLFKSCKNNGRKNNLTAGVSYFTFPSDPFMCAEWISIVARERKDDFCTPAKFSVICSDHFDKSDISVNKNRRRLVKTAVPKLQIQPPPMDLQLPSPNTKLSASDNEVQPLSSSSGLDITPKAIFNQDEAEHISVMTSPVAPVSDLISNREIRRRMFLYKQFLAAREIINTKSKKILNLQKKNNRLVKQNSSLKNKVNMLKKKLKIHETILKDLSKKFEIAEVLNGMCLRNKKQRKKPCSKEEPENLPQNLITYLA